MRDSDEVKKDSTHIFFINRKNLLRIDRIFIQLLTLTVDSCKKQIGMPRNSKSIKKIPFYRI